MRKRSVVRYDRQKTTDCDLVGNITKGIEEYGTDDGEN